MLPISLENSIELQPGRFYLILAPRRAGFTIMSRLAARLAQRGPLLVLDGGNTFSAQEVARSLRQETDAVKAALERLHLARAFTCHQVASRLEAAPLSWLPGPQPMLVMDLLAAFLDEHVNLSERWRVLDQVIEALQRLKTSIPLAASISTGIDRDIETAPGRTNLMPSYVVSQHAAFGASQPLPGMLARLESIADDVLRYDYPLATVQQPALF